jgi:hypothetical protein
LSLTYYKAHARYTAGFHLGSSCTLHIKAGQRQPARVWSVLKLELHGPPRVHRGMSSVK